MIKQPGSHPSVIPESPNTNERRRTESPARFLLQPWMELILANIELVGGIQNLKDVNGLRFKLVYQACYNGDLFCLALHQIFCIWDLPDPTQVTSLPGLPDPSTLPSAFKVLGQLILENQRLAPNHKKWFARYPSPLGHLMKESGPYRRSIEEVGAFLGKLSADWESLLRDCTARQYPPRVDEMVDRLGLLSPMLRNVVFTAVLCNLRTHDDPYRNNMEFVIENYMAYPPVLDNHHGIGTQPQEQLESRAEVSSLNRSSPVSTRGIFFTIRGKDGLYDLENPIPAAYMREKSLLSIWGIVSERSGILLQTIRRMTLKSVFAEKYAQNIVDVLHRDAGEQEWNDVKGKIRRRYEFGIANDLMPEKFEILIEVGASADVVSEDMYAGLPIAKEGR